jgi:hypothetical protein
MLVILLIVIGCGFIGIYHDTHITNELLRDILEELRRIK